MYSVQIARRPVLSVFPGVGGPTFGALDSRSAALEEGVTSFLQSLRLNPYPKNPEWPWNVSSETLERWISGVLSFTDGTYSRAQAEDALLRRGFQRKDALPPHYNEPADPVVTTPVLDPVPAPASVPVVAEQPPPPDYRQPIREIVTIQPVTDRFRTPSPTLPRREELDPGYRLPVIVPGSPVDVPREPAAEASSQFPFFWVLLGGALFLSLTERAKRKYRPGGGMQGAEKRPKRAPVGARRQGPIGQDFSGELMNCGAWMEVENKRTGGLIWRCLAYNPAPAKKTCYTDGAGKSLKMCVKQKRIRPASSRYKKDTIFRCSRYAQICPTGATQAKPLDKPPASSMHGRDVSKEIRDMARYFAQEASEGQEELKELGREVVTSGGIKPYSDGRGYKDELRVVPLFMRRSDGFTADVIASELGFEDDTELLKAIAKEYPPGERKIRQHDPRDFMEQARQWVYDKYEEMDEEIERQRLAARLSGTPGQGEQKELWPGLRRELTLEIQDVATSDDPVTACMERLGWKIPRMVQLRESIAEKMVPDMFGAKMKKLSKSEKEYQAAMQKCLSRHSGTAGLGQLSTHLIRAGVVKAVKQDKSRMAHGDTGIRAFFITPDGDILPWMEHAGLHGGRENPVSNVGIHSHSAENWNHLMDLTGHEEPPTRFSNQDIVNFHYRHYQGKQDAAALIMGDGRLHIARCPYPKSGFMGDSQFARLRETQIKGRLNLPRGWRDKPKYKGLDWREAKLLRQKEFFEKVGCSWEDARWRPVGDSQPKLFHDIGRSRQTQLKFFASDPQYKHTPKETKSGRKPRSARGRYDLSKEFWIKIPGWVHPAEPTQQELFTHKVTIAPGEKGERYLTAEALPTKQQALLFGGGHERAI